MQVYYLEIVTEDVEAVCAAYGAALSVEFGEPDEGLGHARTAPLRDGGLVGVRAPFAAENPTVIHPVHGRGGVLEQLGT